MDNFFQKFVPGDSTFGAYFYGSIRAKPPLRASNMNLRTNWKRWSIALDRMLALLPSWQLNIICYCLWMLAVTLQLIGKIPLTVFYAIPISMLAWYAGSLAAFSLSVVTVFVSVVILYLSNSPPGVMDVLVQLIRFSFWIFLSIAMPALHRLQSHLYSQAKERELALANEVAARRKLEQEMLDSAERKQRGIGRDMHDGLSQHLVATAMISYAHAQQLSSAGSEGAKKAHKIVDLVEQAITLARAISEALHPIEMSGNDLMSALEQFASTTSKLFGLQCRFECLVPVIVDVPPIAEHLFRITQEGVSNAIRHGHATKIDISLQELDAGLQLCVSDNGTGIADVTPNRKGMGLQIMAARSQFIGGRFSLSRKMSGGTNLICLVPAS
jgi:signal transduction histidine kinase